MLVISIEPLVFIRLTKPFSLEYFTISKKCGYKKFSPPENNEFNIKAPKEVCISHGNLAKAIAGSCCVPGVFVPVEFDDMLLCDGGLQNTIPADIPRYFGCDYVVAVDCHKERTYGTDSQKLFDVLSCAIRILMKSNAVKGYVNADVVIAPETKRFKASRAEGLEEMMEEGYDATIDVMPEIMKLFKKRKPFRSKKYSDPSEIDFV